METSTSKRTPKGELKLWVVSGPDRPDGDHRYWLAVVAASSRITAVMKTKAELSLQGRSYLTQDEITAVEINPTVAQFVLPPTSSIPGVPDIDDTNYFKLRDEPDAQ